MSQADQSKVFPPSSAPRAKVGGGRMMGLDPNVLARAEAALKALSGQFAGWLQDEIDKLDAARGAFQASGHSAETGETLYMRAHDLKGLGGTYEFPLITRLAGSLCRLLEDGAKRAAAPSALIDEHISAIKTAVRDNIRNDAHPVGRAMAEDLEGKVRKHVG